jgi:hypothetical protein
MMPAPVPNTARKATARRASQGYAEGDSDATTNSDETRSASIAEGIHQDNVAGHLARHSGPKVITGHRADLGMGGLWLDSVEDPTLRDIPPTAPETTHMTTRAFGVADRDDRQPSPALDRTKVGIEKPGAPGRYSVRSTRTIDP